MLDADSEDNQDDGQLDGNGPDTDADDKKNLGTQ